ncbi:MAG TPA: hypothetical protein VGA73_13670 [Candidatus Binatia bacterium]
MSETRAEVKLQDGTLIRHKLMGYEGRTDGTTTLKSCFTRDGESIGNAPAKQAFQYRVLVAGETMRRIAPIEDLEVLEGVTEIACPACHFSFHSRPGFANKPAGRCSCGGWICPACSMCQEKAPCAKQRLRLARKAVANKKPKSS